VVIIALDTSQAVGSVALSRDGAVLGTERFRAPSSHLVALGRAVEQLLAAHRLAPADVDRLAVVVGPGSFTGLRIGLSFVKGLHAARGAGVVTIDSLRLLALPLLSVHERVCSLIDARRGEVYAAVYERAGEAERATDPAAARECLAPCARDPIALLDSLRSAPAAFAGTGAIAHRAAIAARFPFATIVETDEGMPSAAYLAAIAHGLHAIDHAAIRDLEPTYVRASGAERVRLRAHALRPAAEATDDAPPDSSAPSRESGDA
jgi:tRNA threonylcarbamoyladenosine biosynthesis protein TsaB